jgi:hypothetical protein
LKTEQTKRRGKRSRAGFFFAHKKMLDQTIPLRVTADLKIKLIELSKTDKRSLNAYLNIQLEKIVQPIETPHKSIVKTKAKTKAKK